MNQPEPDLLTKGADDPIIVEDTVKVPLTYDEYLAKKIAKRKRQRTPGAFGGTRTGRRKRIKIPRGRMAVRKMMFDLKIRTANFKRLMVKKGRAVELLRMKEKVEQYKEDLKNAQEDNTD